MPCSLRACLLLSLSALLLPAAACHGQGAQADYQRADALAGRVRGKVARLDVRPNWLEDGKRFWYRVDLGEGQGRFLLVDAEQGEQRPAFDHERLAAALFARTNQPQVSDKLPFFSIRFPSDGVLEFAAEGQGWRCDLATYQLTKAEVDLEGAESTVRVLGGVRPAGGTGEDTQITFINRTEGPVSIYWVSGQNRRSYVELEPGDSHVQHTYDGHVWLAENASGKTVGVYQAVSPPGMAVIDGSWQPRERRRRRGSRGDNQGAISPDERWRVEIVDHNVQLVDRESGDPSQLTTDGTADDAYLPRFFWSPDSEKLIVLREQPGQGREISFVESSPADQLQPKLHTFEYVKPGDRLARQLPCLFHIKHKQQVPVDDSLFDNPWSLERFEWEPDSSRFTFLYNQRGHQVLRLVGVDAASGETSALIDEQADTFLCYSSKLYLHRVANNEAADAEWIWMSERDGWNHLYLCDAGGSVKPITSGAWAVRGVDRVDDEKRQIWFHAGGKRPDQDPYHVHYYRIDFDGANLVELTEGDGTHDLTDSPDGQTYLDRYSRVDLPPVTELRRSSDGKLLCELQRGDWSELLADGWQPPIRFVAKGRDDQTDIHGVIYRPTNFNPDKQYPVIEQIYAGPHSAHVPKRFAPFHGGQEMAELGFIVVQIDGMGTSHRSKAFHDVCWQDLADAGFPDRVRWIKAAAERYKWMDATRVGVYGGSAGGQNALRALIDHGDFYSAAAADCGCHDNRMDKVWWNEQWMGWPVGTHYEQSSNVTQAHRMQGKLLLTVGELDRNVDPASTMQVVDALIKADKDFELIVFPGGGHGSGGSAYGKRRMRDFFVRNLWGLEPRRAE
ncbi:Prolyl tripeptidyl peptidase precursor [Posidoniimonas polymericola]|uniref:Prolyl tripeptidyl peptidase n=1 Tax=Posidoniimonas polymericola TaxID=2528002 RepID=A0A5C5YAH7_9BACT|nr:prolyl oligopeptidase family serine peptidase [Posidoniimonas polymericola]TWT72687.1 Prolyl tripeptidyl peptidase precursor [Posidoniimonas polymericola]